MTIRQQTTLAAATALFATAGFAHAATITGSFTQTSGNTGNTDVTLTSSPVPLPTDPGFGDWKVWNNTSGTTDLNGSDEKLVSDLIGSLSEIDNGTNNFSTGSGLASNAGAAAFDWAWSDGTPDLTDSQVSGTNNGGLQSNTGGDNGDGYRLPITVATTSGTIRLYVGVRESTATLRVTSSTQPTNFTLGGPANTGGNAAGIYTINFSNATPGEVLIFDYTLNNTADADRRLRYFGAAVDVTGVIPEPASLALLGLGGLLLLPRRKR